MSTSSITNSHVTGADSPPLLDVTIGQLLHKAALDYPDNLAIISSHQGSAITYSEFNILVDSVARNLIALGLKKGDRIGIWSPNNWEWITLLYAAARAGLVLVNINPAYRVSELEYALNKVECRLLVMVSKFKTSDYVAMMSELIPDIHTSSATSLNSERVPSLDSVVLIDVESEPGFLDFSLLTAKGNDESINLDSSSCSSKPDDVVNIQFTSGTTGNPKAATLTHKNIVNNAYFTGKGIGLLSSDKLCCPVPLYHCFGMVLATLACCNYGATLVLPAAYFDPVSTVNAIDKEECTVLYGVPTMFSEILNHSTRAGMSFPYLRTGIVAGALCPKELMERIIGDLGMTEITNCYGMTETSPVSFQSATDEDLDTKTTTVGSIHPHVEARVVGSNGEILNRGERGELCVRGYSVMKGYWGDQNKTDEVIVDGWMHTGDEAVIDQNGKCSIVGRIKDTIIRGGENIAPKEVEEFLLTHSGIDEAQVFGVKDQKYGELVAAWLRLKEGVSLTNEDILDYARDQIAHHKIPSHIRFVDEFPMTVTGKIQKFMMRAEMEKELAESKKT